MTGTIRLDIYQGPLDLLLALVERKEIDIQAISVAEVAGQYLEYLHEVEELDLDQAGDFIVLGAELLALKARVLLRHPEEGSTGGEEELEEDPAQLLARRLLVYRCYRRAAVSLGELAAQGSLIYGRPLDQEAVAMVLAGINPLAGVTPDDLARAFMRALARRHNSSPHEEPPAIPRPVLTLAGQLRFIMRRLHREREATLDSLLGFRPTRREVALTLLALLELARRNRVTLVQEESFGRIKIKWHDAAVTPVAAGK